MANTPKKDKALRWPIGILLGTVGIIALSVGTIIFALQNPVQLDNDYNSKYREIDKNINDIIEANIEFNKHYKLSYVKHPLKLKGTLIAYTLTPLKHKAVKDVKIEAVLTRPNEVNNNIILTFKDKGNGLYEADLVDLPLEGRWNLFATVTVGDKKGFLRLRLDSRYPDDILPFGTVIPMT